MFYVLDDNNNKIEALDKEGVLAALEEAIATGNLESLVADSAFVTKLKCCITGGTTKMAFVTTAQYNELEAGGAIEKGVAYFIIDDNTIDGLNDIITEILNGKTSVPRAELADKAKVADDTFAVSGVKFLIKNGVIQMDRKVIPQKKLLFSGSSTSVTLNENVKVGDTVEIRYRIAYGIGTVTVYMCSASLTSHYEHICVLDSDGQNTTRCIVTIKVDATTSTITVKQPSGSSMDYAIERVYKVLG